MKNCHQRRRRGFTLLELTLAVAMGMAVSAMLLTLANQQLAFLKIFSAQSFISDEAPVISNYVSKVLGKAERFRLHDSRADALVGANPRLTPSPVLVLNFRQPDGSMRASILSFENRGDGSALYYYVEAADKTWSAPEWTVSRQPRNVSFSVEQGILRMTLTGVNGEEIIYSGSMQQ